MSDDRDLNGSRTPRLENKITMGNVLTVAALLGTGLIGWGATQSNIAALAQRVEKGEARDDETSRALRGLEGNIIELKGDQKAIRTETERQGRQLDRIEQQLQTLVRNGTPPRVNP